MQQRGPTLIRDEDTNVESQQSPQTATTTCGTCKLVQCICDTAKKNKKEAGAYYLSGIVGGIIGGVTAAEAGLSLALRFVGIFGGCATGCAVVACACKVVPCVCNAIRNKNEGGEETKPLIPPSSPSITKG